MLQYTRKLFVICCFLLFFVSGCIHWPDTFIPERLTQEERFLQQLTANLKSENWHETGRLFSKGYHSGFDALREQIESGWQTHDLVELKFTVQDMKQTAGTTHIRAEWHKTSLNKAGKPIDETGVSDILLKQAEESLRILAIKGDSFL